MSLRNRVVKTRPALATSPFRPDWISVIGITALHLGALLAFLPQFFTWPALIAAVIMYWLCGGIGITLGYHRLLTHRSFRTYKPLEYLITMFGTLNWQGGPATWVGTHRLHHADSDHDGDPHSPRHGFTWAHATWTLMKHPEGYDPRKAAKDILRDPVLRWLDRYFIIPLLAITALFYLIGGWPMVIWAVCVRTVVGYHTTWLVNSAAHTWGYRNFKTTDDSRNNFLVALLSFGEGWHNNHHAQQRSAAHGMRWWELDVTYITIRLMGMVGLAWDIVKPVHNYDEAAKPASVKDKAPDATAKPEAALAAAATPASRESRESRGDSHDSLGPAVVAKITSALTPPEPSSPG